MSVSGMIVGLGILSGLSSFSPTAGLVLGALYGLISYALWWAIIVFSSPDHDDLTEERVSPVVGALSLFLPIILVAFVCVVAGVCLWLLPSEIKARFTKQKPSYP